MWFHFHQNKSYVKHFMLFVRIFKKIVVLFISELIALNYHSFLIYIYYSRIYLNAILWLALAFFWGLCLAFLISKICYTVTVLRSARWLFTNRFASIRIKNEKEWSKPKQQKNQYHSEGIEQNSMQMSFFDWKKTLILSCRNSTKRRSRPEYLPPAMYIRLIFW